MTNAPERIWIDRGWEKSDHQPEPYYYEEDEIENGPLNLIEYVRADLVQRQIEKALQDAALGLLASEGQHCEAIAAAVAAEREACAKVADSCSNTTVAAAAIRARSET